MGHHCTVTYHMLLHPTVRSVGNSGTRRWTRTMCVGAGRRFIPFQTAAPPRTDAPDHGQLGPAAIRAIGPGAGRRASVVLSHCADDLCSCLGSAAGRSRCRDRQELCASHRVRTRQTIYPGHRAAGARAWPRLGFMSCAGSEPAPCLCPRSDRWALALARPLGIALSRSLKGQQWPGFVGRCPAYAP